MDTVSYANMLERKLVEQFRSQFFDKLGYYPIVLTKSDESIKGTITLEQLDTIFDEYVPFFNGVKPKLKTKLRKRELVELRCIFCYMAKQLKYTSTSIGKYLGNRDHTTVLHNLNVFKNLMETDETFRSKFYVIKKDIDNQFKINIDESSDLANM